MDIDEAYMVNLIHFLEIILVSCISLYCSSPSPMAYNQLKKLALTDQILSSTLENITAQWCSYCFRPISNEGLYRFKTQDQIHRYISFTSRFVLKMKATALLL